MTLEVRVDPVAVARIGRNLRRLGPPQVEPVVEEAGQVLAEQASANAPRATGALAGSITAHASGLQARVWSSLPYAAPQEFGRHPGSQPPADAFRGGYVAARAVARRGIPGRFFMRRAIETFQQFRLQQLMRRAADDARAVWRS